MSSDAAPTNAPVSVVIDDGVAVVRLDDGKANAVSHEAIDLVHAALDRSLEDARAVVIAGRPGRFSAGFDLKVMGAGDQPMQELVLAGAGLFLRLYGHPQPVVAACTGHALAGGAILLLAADTRIGAAGDFKVGLNEVGIGMTLPAFAVEMARDRLRTHLLTSATVLGQVFDPDGAVDAGYLDRVVAGDAVVDEAVAEARRLAELRSGAVAGTKRRLRAATLQRCRATLEDDVAELTAPPAG
ncbi:crotonase/enoyl-CoA hydratase family protein [Actinomarinicola tropica]|uniref:Crotonase/enoyl-CoA hydratase family protein n=1 Tax=Actinomarinicola tropica TaxID=2789776 RepID=A0A5Q2RPT2_9ACTN|nr:crotonase/enoyl-CoA hydratase family protein [Actinomarinicola tropica]QGG96127.1 crotonase/enoyl-CoA hydratase family protein [Actinomarinicola tropica]